MKPIFHYHLTVSETDSECLKFYAKMIGAKATEIDLTLDKDVQKDRMLTKYFKSFDEAADHSNWAIRELDIHGVKVTRTKIELVLSQFREIPGACYYEAHLKVDEDFVITCDRQPLKSAIQNYVRLSTNPVQGNRFINIRVPTDRGPIMAGLLAALSGYAKSVQIEACMLDTNQASDNLWMPPAGMLRGTIPDVQML